MNPLQIAEEVFSTDLPTEDGEYYWVRLNKEVGEKLKDQLLQKYKDPKPLKVSVVSRDPLEIYVSKIGRFEEDDTLFEFAGPIPKPNDENVHPNERTS